MKGSLRWTTQYKHVGANRRSSVVIWKGWYTKRERIAYSTALKVNDKSPLDLKYYLKLQCL